MYLLKWTKHSFPKEPNTRCSFPTSHSFCPVSGKSPVLVFFSTAVIPPALGSLFARFFCACLPVTAAWFLHVLPSSHRCPARQAGSVRAKPSFEFWAGSHGYCPQSWLQPAGLWQPVLTGAWWSGLHSPVAQLQQNTGKTLAESQEDCMGLKQLFFFFFFGLSALTLI